MMPRSQDAPDAKGPGMWRRIVRRLAVAVTSLSIVPIPIPSDVDEGDFAASRWGFPVVGLLLGLALGALSWSLDRAGCSGPIAAVLLLTTWAIAAGGLHLDGLADTADGLFLGGGPDRRLAAMRDPHIGSFGVMALILDLIGKYASLSSLSGSRRIRAILLAAIVGRCMILVSAGSARYARPEGTGRTVIDATGIYGSVFGATVALISSFCLSGATGLVASVMAIILVLGISALARDRIDGVTGDILGASVELAEWAALVVLGWRSAS